MNLVECTITFGPLNSFSLFPFEEINRKLLRFLHGYDLIGEKLFKIYSTSKFLLNNSKQIQNKDIELFISKYLSIKSSNKKHLIVKQ
jgi:hypothetical protein